MQTIIFQAKNITRHADFIAPPATGFAWYVLSRSAFLAEKEQLCAPGAALATLLPLHAQDILNPQHPSNYDYGRDYELLIMHRLVQQQEREIQTQPLACILFANALWTIVDDAAPISEDWLQRLSAPTRPPTHAADLMLRLLNMVVDHYLNLRSGLTQSVKQWQEHLFTQGPAIRDWQGLLRCREHLAEIEDVCEAQHDAMQEWLDGLMDTPRAAPASPQSAALQETLTARSRDIIDHIARVRHHIARLDNTLNNTIQIHFNAQSHHANLVMQILTALTAIFLPLNFITGFFGMNFDAMPLIHQSWGIWVAVGAMLVLFIALLLYFWRKRYLTRTNRP